MIKKALAEVGIELKPDMTTENVFSDLQKLFSENEDNFNKCCFDYRDKRCNYQGEITTCNKTIEDCKQHGNIARFGGFLPIGCG